MPIYTIETPGGRRLTIEAADEAAAMRGAQEWHAAQGGQPEQPEAPQQAPAAEPSQRGAWLDSFVGQGLLMSLGDEAKAGVRAAVKAPFSDETFGQIYDQQLESNRADLEGYRERHPYLAPALEVGGAVAGTLATGGGSLIPRAGTAIGRVGAGIAEGAARGGVYGFGAGEGGLANRAQSAAVGAGLGGAVPPVLQGVGKALGVGRAGAVAIDAVRAAKNAAYKFVDNLGASYTPGAYAVLMASIRRAAQKDHLNPLRHPKAASMIDDLEALGGQPHSLTELDQLRQVVRRDVVQSGDDAEEHFGDMIMDRIDAFIDAAQPAHMASGSSRQAASAILHARALNTRLRKAEMIEDAVSRAVRRAQSTGSGGNVDNAIRQNIRSILDRPARVRSFTQAERKIMEEIVSGSRGQNLLRLIGKLSPQGSGLMAALSIGATATNPLMAIPAGLGIGAKTIADGMTRGRVNQLERMIRGPVGAHRGLRAAPSQMLATGAVSGGLQTKR